MNKQLKEKLKILPNLSGCYLYHDKNGEIIYIGKAKNLKNRVSSYFRASEPRLKGKTTLLPETPFNANEQDRKDYGNPKLNILVPQIENLEYIITNSEAEALILESHLIKKHQPKYNILLKDDKKYPYFLVTDEEFPRIIVTRKRNLNVLRGRYYGPYTDARAMYSTLDFLKKIFPLKQCKTPKFKNRPCLYYQIGRCLAPCQGLVTPDEYKSLIEKVELFLKGKQSELLKQLMEQIKVYSNSQQYEKAARLRDSYLDLQKTLERQKVVYENTKMNEDVISLMYDDGIFAIVILMIREGRLIDKKDFTYELDTSLYSLPLTLNPSPLGGEGNNLKPSPLGGEGGRRPDEGSKTEFFETFLKEYYSNLSMEFPDKIVSRELEALGDKTLYQEWLEILSKKKIKISYGKTKQGEELQALADKNAKVLLNNAKIEKMSKIRDDFNEIGSFLAEKLKLKNFPHKIECYDISHIQGTNTVASMVTFVNGLSKKSAYKKFKIKSTEGKPDDFLSMKEVLTRRLKRLGEEGVNDGWEKPDLIIIDGGKGQLSAVMKIVEGLGTDKQLSSSAAKENKSLSTFQPFDLSTIDFVSLAKREEEIFLPNQSKPIILPKNSSALFLFQRIRDEAHRFAITYHKKLRSKKLIK